MRAGIVLLAAAAFPALAQVARVDVYTPSPMLIVGEELRLAAAARNAAETILIDSPLTYTSNQPAILSVDARGTVRALRPGQANITVRSGNQQAIVEIMAAPKRIGVEPALRDLVPGDRVQYTATAYDINDNPIPNVTFTWAVTGANGGQINAATIVAGTGILTTNGVSDLTIRANLNFAARAARIPPQLIGTARANVRAKVDYRLARLISTEDSRERYAMRRVLANIVGNDRGQLVFRASLDGVSSCVVLYSEDQFRCVASAGQPRPLGGNIITPFGPASINNRGDILVAASGVGLLQIDASGRHSYPIQDGAYFGDYVMAGGFNVSKKSLNNSGGIVWAFNYRRTSDNVTLRGLARLVEGEPEFVWNTSQRLPGLTGTPFLEDWGIDRNGVVYFLAAVGAGRAIYRAERFQAPQRLIGLGDANEGSTINGISGLQVAENGTTGFLIGRQNGQVAVARIRPGAAVETLRSTGNPTNPLAIASNGALLFRGDTGAGYGLYRWQDTANVLVHMQRNTPAGEAVTTFNAGTITSGGQVYAQAASATREFVLYAAADRSPTLLQTGGDITVSGRVHLPVGGGIIPGEKPGNPRVRLGDVRTAYEVEPGGRLTPRLVDLDPLPDNNRFFGDGNSFEEPNGGLMFVVNNSIFRQLASGIDWLVRNQLTTDDNQRLSFSTGLRPAMNAAGTMALLAATQAGERRIYLRSASGQLQRLGAVNSTRVAGGDVITNVRSLALDNLGRVMAFLDVRGAVPSLYLWNGREWAAVAVPLETDIDRQPLRDIVRGPLGGGNKFYLIVNRGAAGQTTIPALVEYGADRWTPIVTAGDALPHGGSVATFGVFDVNNDGEVAMAINGNTGGASGLVLRTADGNLRLVHQLVRPVFGKEEYVTGYSEVDLRSGGRVFFGSMNIFDAYSIYAAEPAR
ncbi:MAG: hypothetical protein FJW31_18670 [Acidobacteria bacterium]|nr:hypothetical protein [Acidobacteriota bacterium]